jgi:GNAT superfamily N-acetyltransferase
MFAVATVDAPTPSLRAEYLDLLPEPLELFVEKRVADGACWSLRRDGREIGYAVVDRAGALVEFHVTPVELRWASEAFAVLEESCRVRRVLAKSFDATVTFVALRRPLEARTTGLLYRVIADPSFTADARIRVRAATQDDVATLLRLGADFFDNAAEIEDYIATDGLMIFEADDGVALGAGVMKRVVAGRDDVDIGMVVDPGFRRKRHGAYIVAHLKAYCLARGLRPICGCAVDNVASQRTLERAGFASRHRLLEFQL